MVELQLDEDLPEGLMIGFSICTTLLVAVHMLALMISTCILPNVEAVSMVAGADVSESPHEKMHLYIETAWAFSTVFGILLFLTEIVILSWVKFYDYSYYSATAATVIIIPVIIIFVAFAFHFYTKLVTHKYECTAQGLQELESMATQLRSNGSNLSANGPYVLNV